MIVEINYRNSITQKEMFVITNKIKRTNSHYFVLNFMLFFALFISLIVGYIWPLILLLHLEILNRSILSLYRSF